MSSLYNVTLVDVFQGLALSLEIRGRIEVRALGMEIKTYLECVTPFNLVLIL